MNPKTSDCTISKLGFCMCASRGQSSVCMQPGECVLIMCMGAQVKALYPEEMESCR